jgi:hypothetical protein
MIGNITDAMRRTMLRILLPLACMAIAAALTLAEERGCRCGPNVVLIMTDDK